MVYINIYIYMKISQSDADDFRKRETCHLKATHSRAAWIRLDQGWPDALGEKGKEWRTAMPPDCTLVGCFGHLKEWCPQQFSISIYFILFLRSNDYFWCMNRAPFLATPITRRCSWAGEHPNNWILAMVLGSRLRWGHPSQCPAWKATFRWSEQVLSNCQWLI